MTTSLKIKHSVLALALAAAYPLQALAASAGVAQFIAGDVNVRRPDGQTNPLAKGTDIESGQAILTGTTGRAQVKFTDGGLISLQPNTELKIASYVDKADPQEDRFLVDFLRGSMRAITGLIGKRNRANYKVTTTTATIGIRGSGFSAGYNPDGTLGVTAEKDAIEVCSGGSCVGLVAGESVKVNSSNEPPVRTSNRASVPTPAPAQEVVTAGNQTTSDGKSALITTGVVRTFNDIQVSVAGSNLSTNPATGAELKTSAGATTVFTDNKLTQFTDNSFGTPKWSESGTAAPVATFKSMGNVTDANFIGWGMWTKATREYFGTTMLDQVHYVAGRPAPVSAINSTIVATYNLIGSTAPTYNGATGTLNSATLNITGSTTYNLGVIIDTSFTGAFNDTALILAGSPTPQFAGAFIKGMFIGPTAGFVGMTYSKFLTNGPVTGSLAFQR